MRAGFLYRVRRCIPSSSAARVKLIPILGLVGDVFSFRQVRNKQSASFRCFVIHTHPKMEDATLWRFSNVESVGYGSKTAPAWWFCSRHPNPCKDQPRRPSVTSGFQIRCAHPVDPLPSLKLILQRS